ncbi:hypothetical protein LOK49_LG05G01135, partial [Camellia lanceoleosa]
SIFGCTLCILLYGVETSFQSLRIPPKKLDPMVVSFWSILACMFMLTMWLNAYSIPKITSKPDIAITTNKNGSRSKMKGPARASKAPFEREDQILDINFWFQSTTNLFQTCPTQPKTQIQRVRGGNENETTTQPRNQVRKTIYKVKENRNRYRISLASPKVREPTPASLTTGLFYCVIYLKPGDYHQIHSPVDWNVLVRRHFQSYYLSNLSNLVCQFSTLIIVFTGRLFPLNERAARTIRNLYVENERLFIEPELWTNQPRKNLLHSEPPEERVYELEAIVILIFQAPISKSLEDDSASSEFRFCIRRRDRIHVREALGRWHDS